jgi:4-amino-4-deoxy-L-arabinose transferase-like glycosyltransferase
MSVAARAQPRRGAALRPSLGALSRWSTPAWGAIGVTAAFVGLTCWWLTQDRSIPVFDAGDHLETAVLFHKMISSGDLLGPFNYESPYPPLTESIGALSAFIGGVSVAAPIVGENLIFVTLLALGCYRTGRMLFGASAGLLAVAFVLGSPLLIAQLHVFMLDAPETAMVAVSIWLLLASSDFSRVGIAAVAGLAVGVGALTKVQYPPFVIGMILMMLLRGGWRNRRGLVVFAVVALVVALPWYLDHLSQFATFAHIANPHAGVPNGDTPPTFSLGNLGWYLWNILNSQFLAPLFAFIVVGAIWMSITVYRHRRVALAPASGQSDRFGMMLELLAGAVVAWLLITVTPSHDIRYAMPLMPYLAVIATGWIFSLPRVGRRVAIAVVVAGVCANTLSTTFGVGGTVQVALAHPLPAGEELADDVKIYSNQGFIVAGPQRDGDVPGLLDALRREGVEVVTFVTSQLESADFSGEGLGVLVMIAGMTPSVETALANTTPAAVVLTHQSVSSGLPAPCTTLSDGTGVWVLRRNPGTGGVGFYCPLRHPRYYS